MSDTMITSDETTEYGRYISAACGKTSADVFIYSHEVRVIVKNASHKVWRGAGKGFKDIATAVESYKSGDMKSILFAVAGMIG